MSIPWLIEKKELKNESRESYRGSHECSQTFFGARAKSLKNAYVKSKLNGLGNDPNNQNYWCREEYWKVHEVTRGFRKLMHRMKIKLNGPGNDPNNQNYRCRKEYWMVHEVSSGFGKLMHRKQSKLYGPGYDQMD